MAKFGVCVCVRLKVALLVDERCTLKADIHDTQHNLNNKEKRRNWGREHILSLFLLGGILMIASRNCRCVLFGGNSIELTARKYERTHTQTKPAEKSNECAAGAFALSRKIEANVRERWSQRAYGPLQWKSHKNQTISK